MNPNPPQLIPFMHAHSYRQVSPHSSSPFLQPLLHSLRRAHSHTHDVIICVRGPCLFQSQRVHPIIRPVNLRRPRCQPSPAILNIGIRAPSLSRERELRRMRELHFLHVSVMRQLAAGLQDRHLGLTVQVVERAIGCRYAVHDVFDGIPAAFQHGRRQEDVQPRLLCYVNDNER